ncbi:Ca2+:H+ antiporter [Melampsora americana]|nr:Ca2+:H+ antiporter [Melampsora americana]
MPNSKESTNIESDSTPTTSDPRSTTPLPTSESLVKPQLLSDLEPPTLLPKGPRISQPDSSLHRDRSRESSHPELSNINTNLVTTSASHISGTQKGKARASLSKQPANPIGTTPPSALKTTRVRREQNLTSDAGSDHETNFLPPSRPTSVNNPSDPHGTSPVTTLFHLPPPSSNVAQVPQSYSIANRVSVDDDDDDGVEPIDRGEALVRRRMKERQRLKKEAERRQRRVEDDTTRSRTSHSRPTASRTRTAPAHPHQLQTSQPPAFSDSVSHLNEPLGSPSTNLIHDPMSRSGHIPRSASQYDPTSASSRVHPALDFDRQRGISASTRGRSPDTVQSTYQSFGSPSQFTSGSLKSSEHGVGMSSSPTSKNVPPLLGKSSRSSLMSLGQRGGVTMSDAVAESEADEVYEDGEEGQEYFDLHTPIARGRSRELPGQSMRSPIMSQHTNLQLESPSRPKSTARHASVYVPEPSSSEEDQSPQGQLDGNQPAEAENTSSDSASSDLNDEDVEYTLKDRQDAINIEHPFGLPIWKPALYKKSRSVARNAEAALHDSPTSTSVSTLTPGNILWALLFGSPLAFVFSLVAAVLFVIPWGGSKYGRVVWELAGYLIWPFGKYVEEWSEEEEGEEGEEGSQQEEGANRLNVHSSRWEAVSDIGDDDNESVDRLTIRGDVHERTSLTAAEAGPNRLSLPPNYGATRGARPRPPNRVSSSSTSTDMTAMLDNSASKDIPTSHRQAGQKYHQIRVRALGRLSFWTVYYLVIAPMMLASCLLCWFFVFPIPMAKLLWVLVRHVGTEPLALHFRSPPTFIDLNQIEYGKAGLGGNREVSSTHRAEAQSDSTPGGFGSLPRLKPGQPAPKHSKKSLSASRAKGRLVSGKAKVLLCTYKALGLQYYKYTVDGVNIMFIILMPFVIFVIFDAFFLVPLHLTGFLGLISSQGVIFVMALLSVVPLSYFIGMAVASISAQSSIGMGAVINATFGSIIEILLYGIALTEGKGDLVEGSIIGSVLAGVLLMPGMSMIGGSVRRKEQKFNARSAGVTSTMLIMAIIGVLTPTLFYEIYGTFQLTCSGCPDGVSTKPGEINPAALWQCKRCRYEHLSPVNDEFYQTSVKGLSYYCAALLVLSYLIGLWFSLRTHASQIWQTPAAAPHAADHGNQMLAPNHAEQDMSGNTNQQRMSMYVRKLPEIVKQQLLPHIQKNPATHTVQSDHRASGSGSIHSPYNLKAGAGDNSLSLERTLTAEEVDRTIKVLEMATARHLSTTPAHMLKHQYSSHSRDASRSHPNSQQPQHHQIDVNVTSGIEPDGGSGHDAPNWSRNKSTTVLLSCTLLYAVIAEILVSVVDVVLDGSGIPEKLLGVTLFALVPNTTEFMNAISFAINGNIALSMEIGSAYALQVCLIQIPAMIAISAIYNSGKYISAHHTFTLVFPRWDVISIVFSVFLLTYTYIEARANYHRGTILVLSYLVLVGGFYSAPVGGSVTEGN